MPGTITKSLRLEENIVQQINTKCDEIGMSFNDFILYALNVQFGIENDNSLELLKLLAQWIRKHYSKDSFPDDITLRVFHQIRDSEQLSKIYNSIIYGEKKLKNIQLMISLHRRIGRMVKMILNAKVKARSIPLDPELNLIKTYSLLEPK